MARNNHPDVTVKRIIDTALNLFMKKGCDATTINDIINQLGDLSKGAIYYHFKSKEEIIDAVLDSVYSERNKHWLDTIKSGHTGLEKIRQLFLESVCDPSQEIIIAAMPNLMKEPRFLAQELSASITEVAPILRKLIQEGVTDGSITTDHPKELSEVLILLANIWINPFIFACSEQELYNKYIYLKEITDKLGLPILDDAIFARVEKLRKLISAQQKKETTNKPDSPILDDAIFTQVEKVRKSISSNRNWKRNNLP